MARSSSASEAGRSWRPLAACVLALAAGGASARAEPLASPSRPSEYEVKAAFLYNFARFVEWPAPADPGARFVIEVVGDDPFGPALERTMAGKTVGGRPIEVRRRHAATARRADIVFVSASERDRLARVLDRAGGPGVLTVGDTDGFAARGVIINFRVEEQRVRFEINPRRAEEAGLKLSSQLLKLATIVDERARR